MSNQYNMAEVTEGAIEEKAAAKKTRSKSILESFEHIVEMAKDSNLDNEFFAKADDHIRYASRKLKLTPMQVVMLALFVDRSEDSHIRMSEIASYAGCRTTRILRLSKEIDVLVEKHYLRQRKSQRSLSFRVHIDVLTALRNNVPYVYTPEPVLDTPAFFDTFKRLVSEKKVEELSYNQLKATVEDSLRQIENTQFARTLKFYSLDDDIQLLFIYMAHLFVENNDDNIGFCDIEDLYDDEEIPSWIRYGLISRSSELITLKLIENVNEDGMAVSNRFKLTEKIKMDLLCELNLSLSAKSEKGLIKHDSFAEKRLIYNATEQEQVAELMSILSKDRFAEVQSRLKSKGMREGFCCIFYGAPGTGKTETVYQIARATGRDIMRVDVDRIKSCWVGESEKNIKSLFDRYRAICETAERAPILLFNEADAVLGVRMEGAARAVDKSENSIQNIILQEMESLNGIMIATTNLTTNLDKAFERRFLYKIRFDKPTKESRAQIWRAMLPALSEDQAAAVAGGFDLSGGEIENITRRLTVNYILSGRDELDMNEIQSLCRQERLSHKSHQARVGF